MSKPTVFWSFKNLPSNRDSVAPLAIEKLESGEEVTLFFNHTTGKFFFECDGDYGVFVSDEGSPGG